MSTSGTPLVEAKGIAKHFGRIEALRDVSFTLGKAEVLGLLGDNGAGKSTLIKLLCRFYQPSGGRILADGVDLADVDPAVWRERIAAGKINFIAECSPLLGPQLMDLAKKVLNGETIPTRIVTNETTFTPEQAKAALPDRKY